jgi:hypothetical protein
MVFGFGKGKIDLVLNRQNFMPGDTISGQIFLKLKEPTQADKMVVNFIGMKKVNKYISSTRGSSRRTQNVPIHEFELVLDREKKYLNEQYTFEIKIPANILQNEQQQGGAMGTAMSALKFLSSGSERVEWYVEVKLDISGSFDVNKKVDITLG